MNSVELHDSLTCISRDFSYSPSNVNLERFSSLSSQIEREAEICSDAKSAESRQSHVSPAESGIFEFLADALSWIIGMDERRYKYKTVEHPVKFNSNITPAELITILDAHVVDTWEPSHGAWARPPETPVIVRTPQTIALAAQVAWTVPELRQVFNDNIFWNFDEVVPHELVEDYAVWVVSHVSKEPAAVGELLHWIHEVFLGSCRDMQQLIEHHFMPIMPTPSLDHYRLRDAFPQVLRAHLPDEGSRVHPVHVLTQPR